MGEWISVNERLPDESGYYIVAAHIADGLALRTTFIRWQKRLQRWELIGYRAYWRVKYWQPLPEPPEEDA